MAAPGQRHSRGRAAVRHHGHHEADVGYRSAQPLLLGVVPVRQGGPWHLEPAGALPVDAVQDDRPGPGRHAKLVQATASASYHERRTRVQ